MRRRAYLAGVGAGLAGAGGIVPGTGTVGGARTATGLTELAVAAAGDPPTDAGSIRVDVVGTSVTGDLEVETVVEGIATALATAHRAETDDGTAADIGIRGYEVHGWSSEASFRTQDACTAIEDAAEKLEGTDVGSVATVVAWLWDYNASWAAGRGIGKPWAGDPDHQHPVFVDNVDNPSVRKMAFSATHEVGHALLSTATGSANCFPEGYDTGAYEACARARRLTAPWYRGHRDHTLGTVVEVDGVPYRTPMAHQGDAYLAGPCRHPEHGAPYNWGFHLSRCTIEAMGHSWRHAEGLEGHDDNDRARPGDVSDATVSVDDGTVTVGWDPVTDPGSAGLAYYGLEVRTHVDGDARALVTDATGTVPAGTTEVTLGGFDPNAEYWFRLTPVDGAGNPARSRYVGTFETGDEVVDPEPADSPVVEAPPTHEQRDPPSIEASEPTGGGQGGSSGGGGAPGNETTTGNGSTTGNGTMPSNVSDPGTDDSEASGGGNASNGGDEDAIPGFGTAAAALGLGGALALRGRGENGSERE